MTHTTTLITGPELCRRLRTSRTVFYGLRARGRIGPKPATGLGHPRWNAAEVAELVAAIQKYSVYAQARGSAPFGTTAEEQAALARHDAGKGGGE